VEHMAINCYVDGALYYMDKAESGAHYLIIYPDLITLRKLYSIYIYKQIMENNEIVLLNPFYETTDSTKQILSQGDSGLDVSISEREKSLIVIDSLEEYFGKQPDMAFKRRLASNAKKIGKNGLSILGDVGAYTHKSKCKDLVDYESSLPIKYDLAMKGFCLYHTKDFDRFTNEQKQQLIEHHGKTLNIIKKREVDPDFFEQPIDFVRHLREGRHIVLFYEEAEYAKIISFQFIESGIEYKKACSYLSEEDIEITKREMTDSGIDVNKSHVNGLLNIYQVPNVIDYHINEDALGQKLSNLGAWQADRLVLKFINKIDTEEQIKSILKWEHEYRLKYLKNGKTSLLCAYPLDNILPAITESTGPHAKWMNDLLTIYDGVVFARRFWKGVAFNLL